MRRSLQVVVLMFALAGVTLAQTTAMPRYGSRMNGSDHIAREVMHELLMLPYYSVFDNLAFKVDGNSVTLLGQVADPSVRSDAEARVKKIEGVDHVTNNIEVLPNSPMDDRIRRAEYRAIYGEDALFKYSMGAVPSIHIIVKNGHVTLVGVVDNEGDKNLALIRAKGVPDVFSVDDQLQVANQRVK